MSFCGLRSLGAYGEGENHPAKIPPAGGEVAKRCGYADSDYFSRLFRRQFGLTPGSIAHAFSDSQNVISAFSRSRILCGVVAANSDSRNVFY